MTKSSELTEIEKDILVNMMEEAAEVIQACSKMLRFGNNDEPHREGMLNNREYLSKELGNFSMTQEAAYQKGLVELSAVHAGANDKRNKWWKNVQ